MKYLRMLGVVAVALMAFAGSASATELYSGATTLKAGTVIKGSLTSTAILEDTEGNVLNKCTGGILEAEVKNAGGSSATVSGPIRKMTWSGCEKGTTTTVGGELEIHHNAGTNNGVLTAKNTETTISALFGTSCVYGAGAALNLGTVNGGNPANLTINTIVPGISGGFLCPSHARWTVNYEVTSPKPMHVTAS
jgi:hypothetical protein